MKIKLSVILVLVLLILVACSDTNNVSVFSNEIENLQKKNESLIKEVSELKKTNDDLSKKLEEELVKNGRLLDEIEQKEKGVKYLDTIVEGKETFTTYENIIKNFGNPKKVKKIIDKHGIYNHGHFAILFYDDIEFTISCSVSEDDSSSIVSYGSVCRVDITGDKYILDRGYLNGIKLGDSAQKIAERHSKEIIEVNQEDCEDRTNMDIVVGVLRDDIEEFKYRRGIYFSGEMDTGLALGIVLVINDDDNVARIIMGLPTAG